MATRRFNAYLRGLLGLLQAKVEGQAPSLLEDAVRVTLDGFPFLQAERREVRFSSTGGISGGAEGFNPDTAGAVPAGELWLVDWFSVWCMVAPGAGEIFQIAPAYQARSIGLGLLATQILSLQMASSTQNVQGHNTALRPVVLLPGDQPGVWVDHIATAVTLEFATVLSFVRCPV